MNQFMKEAKILADENLSSNAGGPFGAVIVKDDKIVGRGANRVLHKNDPTAHAEVEAIRDACKNLNTYDLTDCILYTNCYPCPMCLSAIIWSNIKTVYYGNTKEDSANIGFRDNAIYEFIKENEDYKNTLHLTQIDQEETIKSFQEYQGKEDKTIY